MASVQAAFWWVGAVPAALALLAGRGPLYDVRHGTERDDGAEDARSGGERHGVVGAGRCADGRGGAGVSRSLYLAGDSAVRESDRPQPYAALTLEGKPDVLISDIGMPGKDLVPAIRTCGLSARDLPPWRSRRSSVRKTALLDVAQRRRCASVTTPKPLPGRRPPLAQSPNSPGRSPRVATGCSRHSTGLPRARARCPC